MEVPKTVVEMASSVDQQTGPALIDSVVQATGLPSQIVESELGSILVENGMDPSTLTLEQLRAALLNYLESCAAEFEQLDAEQAMHLGSEYAPEGAAEVANS